jgi:hypothetical protein
VTPLDDRRSGSPAQGMLYHRMRLARPSSLLQESCTRPTPYRALRRLETRVAPRKLATGSAKDLHPRRPSPFQVVLPAATRSESVGLHRLAGLTGGPKAPRPTISGVNSLEAMKHSTRLALQLILVKGFRLYSFQLPDLKKPGIVIYCHYLPVSGLGNLRACCLPWMW